MTRDFAKHLVNRGKEKIVLDFLQKRFKNIYPTTSTHISFIKLLNILQKDLPNVKNTTSTFENEDPLSKNIFKHRVLEFLELEELGVYWDFETNEKNISSFLKKYSLIIIIIIIILCAIVWFSTKPNRPRVEHLGGNTFKFNDVEYRYRENGNVDYYVQLCVDDKPTCKNSPSYPIKANQAKQDISISFDDANFENGKYTYFLVHYVVNSEILKTDTIPCPPIKAK